MAVGHKSAIVVRSRFPGRNLLIQAQGVDVRAVTIAAQEAAQLLEQASQTSDAGDVSPHITGKPLVCGSILLSNDRWRVLYRMIGQLLVLAVVPPACNAFSALDLLERAVRVVTAECRPTETSPERLEKRYPEVYLALGALLSSNCTLTSAAALGEGRSILEAVGSGADKKKAAAAAAAAAGPEGSNPAGSGPAGAGQYKGHRRTLAEHAALLPGMLGFSTEAGLAGVKPLPGWSLATAQQPQVPGLARHQLPVVPTAVPDDLQLEKKKPDAASEDPFDFIKAPLAAKVEKPAPPVAPAAPAVPPAPLLRLTETWRAEVVGGSITRAQLRGALQWHQEALPTATVPAVPFCLALGGAQPHSRHGGAAQEAVRSALGRAHAHPTTLRPLAWPAPPTPPPSAAKVGAAPPPATPASPVPVGAPAFVADVGAAKQQLAPVLLRYSVPPVQAPVPVPVQVLLGVSLQAVGSSTLQTAVLVGVQLQFAPELESGQVSGVEVRLVVPSLFELPSRSSPPGATMDGAKHSLVWQQQQQQQQQGVASTPRSFTAVFLVSAGEAATRAAMRVLSAEVVVKGRGGSTLTGVSLHQYGFGEAVCADACSWAAHVTAKLAHQ